jgi:hypothetical protein
LTTLTSLIRSRRSRVSGTGTDAPIAGSIRTGPQPPEMTCHPRPAAARERATGTPQPQPRSRTSPRPLAPPTAVRRATTELPAPWGDEVASWELCGVAAIWPHPAAKASATTRNVARYIPRSTAVTRRITSRRHTLRIRRLGVRIPPAALAVLARAPSTSRPSRSGEHPAREALGHTLMGDQLGDNRQEQHETPADSGGLHSPGPGMSQQARNRLKTGRSSGGVLSDDLAL